MNNYIVYKHTTPSGKVYVGITCQDVRKRWKNGKGYESCTAFHRAIEKYGWSRIRHEILFAGLSKEEAISKEIELISLFNSTNPEKGYNLTTGGEHYDFSNELKKQISRRVKQTYIEHPEIRTTISEAQKGRKHSEETKRKMRESRNRFLEQHPDRKRECGNSFRGKHRNLTNADKKIPIVCSDGQVFESVSSASKKLGISRTGISNVLTGRSKSCGGFYFCYAGGNENAE
nr:MAG TPA: intron associated endonuclease [Caudoviricetes sp.]